MSESSERRILEVLADTTDRLDVYLATHLEISRTQAARLIGEHAVRVDGEVARASRKPVKGEKIEVTFPEAEPRRPLTPMALDLDVVFEDDHLLVINKPAGLVVHPAPGHWDDTLVNALVARGSIAAPSSQTVRRSDDQAVSPADDEESAWPDDDESEEEGSRPSDRPTVRPSDPTRPGIIHRLDKDTSGLIVVAKNDTAHRKLSHALSLRRIERIYAVLIWGHVKTEIEIEQPIARNPRNRQMMAVVATGRTAKTIITPIARWETTDLVRAKLFTGRTHQIRVHLTHIGHPVVGDPVYRGGGHRRMTGEQRNQALAVDRVTPRQALHAASLRFAHPETREWLEFTSDWPEDLRPALVAAAGDETLLARPKVLEYLGFRA